MHVLVNFSGIYKYSHTILLPNLTFPYTLRLLIAEPEVHHAELLQKVRDLCSKKPLSILKRFSKNKLMENKVNNKSKNDKIESCNASGDNATPESTLNKFDDLETLETVSNVKSNTSMLSIFTSKGRRQAKFTTKS